MFGEQPLPFIPYPTRMESHRFTTPELDMLDLPLWAIESFKQELKWKLNMEMARLWRLLPDAPRGWEWQLDFEQTSDIMHDTITYRVVARLKETP